jgi:ubiquinone/menaquinone biosynthesis C-methylase UbiE
MDLREAEILNEFYDEYERIEEAFQLALDESLHPRSPDLLNEIADGLRLRPGATIVDVGSGKGQHAIRLAQRFPDVTVTGIEPVPAHNEMSTAALDEAARSDASLRNRVRFERGTAESMPLDDDSVDLILSREMLYHVDLPASLAEWRRVLRSGGRVLIYYHIATEAMAPQEATWFFNEGLSGVVTRNMDEQNVESSFTDGGFRMVTRLDLGSEMGERAEEDRGEPGRRLLHAARLLRDPERYKARFGEAAYNIMLGDCFWHIYRMIGKLSTRIYVLAPT